MSIIMHNIMASKVGSKPFSSGSWIQSPFGIDYDESRCTVRKRTRSKLPAQTGINTPLPCPSSSIVKVFHPAFGRLIAGSPDKNFINTP